MGSTVGRPGAPSQQPVSLHPCVFREPLCAPPTQQRSYACTLSRASPCCAVLCVVLSWCLRFGVHRGKTPGSVPMTGISPAITCVPVIALHPTPHGALHALVRASSLRVPCCHASLGPGLFAKAPQCCLALCGVGRFWDDQLRTQLKICSRSIRRRRPLCTFSTCPRSYRALRELEGRPQQGCAHRDASWPGRESRTRSTKAAAEDTSVFLPRHA